MCLFALLLSTAFLLFRLIAPFVSPADVDEDEPPEIKHEREKERRQANNARERYVCFGD